MSKGFRCALTGHRDLPADFDKSALFAALEGLLEEGYYVFYCGMARGFDLMALSYLIERKWAYHVRVEAFIPHSDQAEYYCDEEKKLYDRLLKECEIVHIAAQNYFKGCELYRDRLMVDKADLVFAYLTRDTGGTAYTVRYAQKCGVEVRFL